jgi:hypothetical protein
MKLTKEEKEDILSKYNDDNTSKKFLIHLIRHYHIFESNFQDTLIKNLKFIVIDGKTRLLEGHKKTILNKIASIEKDNWPDIEESVLRRTIKKFLDGYLIDTE